MNEKLVYKEGTVNGMKVGGSKNKKSKKNKKRGNDFKSLIKILCFCVVILILVFVLNAVIRKNVVFDGIYYEEPKDDEVTEVVGDSNNKDDQVNLKLKGDLVITLEVGEEYIEPGFEATSKVDGDVSDYVKISGKVDTSKEGTYQLTYTLDYKGITPTLTRLINVVKEKEEEPKPSEVPSPSPSSSSSPSPSVSSQPSTPATPKPANISLTLNGAETVYVYTGSSYNDAGARAVNNLGADVSGNISVSGSVNTNVAGTYKITYSITNYNGQKLYVSRTVIVQAMNISVRLDNTNYTQSANIIVSVDVANFSYILLPDGRKVTSNTHTYRVTKNGTYEFIVYNTSGESRKASMVVNNIDRDGPKGTCVVKHTSSGSVVTISARDNIGIAYYTYSGTKYYTSTISLGKRIVSGVTINVGFYDTVGNFGSASCISP